jgi:hypothetical protein
MASVGDLRFFMLYAPYSCFYGPYLPMMAIRPLRVTSKVAVGY